jgi:hypothetical protein
MADDAVQRTEPIAILQISSCIALLDALSSAADATSRTALLASSEQATVDEELSWRCWSPRGRLAGPQRIMNRTTGAYSEYEMHASYIRLINGSQTGLFDAQKLIVFFYM